MRRNIRIWGLVSFVFGIFFFINYKLNITGAIIGISGVSPSFNLILGIAFILISLIFFAYTDRLEERLREVEEMELERGSPIIIDTNYLIEACKDPLECKNVLRFIRERYDNGQPIIVPKSVYNEFKFVSKNEGEESRMENLKGTLAKYTTTLDEVRGEEWENPDLKTEANNTAREILLKTPKYIAYKYLSEIDKGNNITVDRFLGRSMGAFSNAFTNEKYEEALHNARREYDKINDKAGSKRKNNLLSSYNVSPADLEILSTALYLQKVPDVLGGRLMDKVDIITKDSHLIDSSKIFSRIHPEMRDKINVREKI